ncbi:hypothetical protein ANTHELSMS3_02598 [Antarctobacter heliothermus]|uniref:Uncharacterized protein n=1 Tax=Antarctobacter heliothermus TaxID=74033 RepID=A0A222E556_9RHOB|nr:hypothetical protein [Antarctobacter heliothermus]ASP21260.1 hypothetical protein ANTHELSMS3_02598 [Antarctobacter heliothermus]
MITQPYLRGLDLPRDPAPRADALVPLTELHAFPDISTAAKTHHAKRFGSAAELLCDSLLMRLGIDSHPSPEFQAFDRLIYLNDRPLRLQIKVRLSAENNAFWFKVAHGNPRHASGVRGYRHDAFDLLALVILHHNVVKFSASKASQQQIALSEIPRLRNHPFESLRSAFNALEVSETLDEAPAQLNAA